MKTKIAYTTVTDENDFFLEQLLVSLVSLKHHSPSAKTVLVTDAESKSTMTGNRAKVLEYIDELIVPKTPEGLSKVMRSRYLKTTLRQHITGDFLYIDTDTVIASPLDEIDEIATSGIQLAGIDDWNLPLEKLQDWMNTFIKKHKYGFKLDAAVDKHYFNSGVMFVADTLDTHAFYSSWYKNWLNFTEKTGFPFDQAALCITNREFPTLMQPLGYEWNCLIMGATGGFDVLNKAKIIHCWASALDKRSNTYIFASQDAYKRIKTEGFIPEDLMPFVLNGKTAFYPYCSIVTGQEYNECMPFRFMLMFYPKSFAIFKFIARAYMFFPNRIKMLLEKK